jgi:hypothetical protein
MIQKTKEGGETDPLDLLKIDFLSLDFIELSSDFPLEGEERAITSQRGRGERGTD